MMSGSTFIPAFFGTPFCYIRAKMPRRQHQVFELQNKVMEELYMAARTTKAKTKHTPKQKRMAEHIEESEQKQGRSNKASERIAWATVNKHTSSHRHS